MLETQGISLHYETLGDRKNPPVMLIAGLGGAGRTFGAVERFAAEHFVVLPDHRGTGQSSRAKDGYTTAQLAADMASLARHVDVGPMNVVGTSTGGMIAQAMALDHPDTVRTLTLASSYARPDAYVKREFALRRDLVESATAEKIFAAYSVFLFSPKWTRDNDAHVRAWIERAASAPLEREISLARIDMILAHDTFDRIAAIEKPTLVLCGDRDQCTPLHLSAELAARIPRAKLVVFEGSGHMIHAEREDEFVHEVTAFMRAKARG